MNRAVLSLPLLLWACNGKVTRDQCTQMLDHYLDMTVASEPDRSLRKSDARYVHVQEQCEAEITQREFRCAMKAPSPETWQACID